MYSNRQMISLLSTCLIRNIITSTLQRCRYSSLAAAEQQHNKSYSNSKNVYTTILPNKCVVVSQDNISPISKIAIIFRAGSRYETFDNLGITHVLRLATGLSTKKSTGFGITRNIQQIGATLTCTTDREIIAYECEVMKNKIDIGLNYLQDIALNQVFHQFEIDETNNNNNIIERLYYDIHQIQPQFRAYDLLHRAAYQSVMGGGGLGNSLFCPKYQIGHITSEMLIKYVRKYFTSNRMAIVGISVDHDYLIEYAKSLPLHNNNNNDDDKTINKIQQSKFYDSNECRLMKRNDNLTHVAIGTEAAGMNNLREAFIFDIFREIIGGGPVIKRGNSNSILGRSLANVLPNKQYGWNSFGSYYSDSGIFGFMLTTESDDIGIGIEAALTALRSGEISTADIHRGKAQLIGTCLYLYEHNTGACIDLKFQASYMGFGISIADVIKTIETVTTDEINSIAKKVAAGKWSLGAIGNLKYVPSVNLL